MVAVALTAVVNIASAEMDAPGVMATAGIGRRRPKGGSRCIRKNSVIYTRFITTLFIKRSGGQVQSRVQRLIGQRVVACKSQ